MLEMTGDGSGAAGSGAAESRAAGARGEGVGAGAGIGAGAGAANATANNPASNSCARNNTLEISTIRSLLLSYGNLALTVFNMLVFRQRTTSCTTTMGRLHADRRGDAAYIGRETRDQRSPIFLLHPLLSYTQREGQQQQVPPCRDLLLLLLLLLLGGSNLFSTRSTNPLLLLFSFRFATISQRLTTVSISRLRASQQYASFPSFSWRLRSSNFPLSPLPQKREQVFPFRAASSFEKRFTIQISFNDSPTNKEYEELGFDRNYSTSGSFIYI